MERDPNLPTFPPGHGWRCTCRGCLDMKNAHARRLRVRTRPELVFATGTRRRIEALCAIGWSLQEQANRIGWDRRNYRRLLTQAAVTPETHGWVRWLYARLKYTPAPYDPGSQLTRSWARRKGFTVPASWIADTIDDPAAKPMVIGDFDEVAVAAAVRGAKRTPLLAVDRDEAIRRLYVAGAPINTIAEILNTGQKTVYRSVALNHFVREKPTTEWVHLRQQRQVA
jgi:hypothetical protein